jgi:hypothetical protein
MGVINWLETVAVRFELVNTREDEGFGLYSVYSDLVLNLNWTEMVNTRLNQFQLLEKASNE